MLNIKNFAQYEPQSNKQKELITSFDVLFLKSEDGQDWYDCQKKFSSDTLKFTYDENGIIRSFSRDVSTLSPLNMSIAELESTPDGLDLSGNWEYKNGEITHRVPAIEELVYLAEKKRSTLLSDVAMSIAPLVDAEILDELTETESEYLKRLRKYRVALSRIDTSTAPDIIWPEQPK